MTRRNRLRNGRKQALFGADGAISAAATIAASLIQANATKEAGRQQSTAIQEQAKTQADALKRQNENNNELQKRQLDFTAQQNEINRAQSKEIQTTLQLLAGQQNTNEMKEAAKIQVKHGGSMRKRLKNIGANTSNAFLRGRNDNLPFVVTDGGGVIPIATTPEGYDLYEIVGNDHEHYHKSKLGSRYKSGVGIKFPGGGIIEGEGNQNSNLGELMLVTPNDVQFISKHSIKGYNPAKAVLAGVHPMQAFATQEAIKDRYGISDDGKGNSNSPVRSMKLNGGVDYVPTTPDLSLDFLAPVATGVVAGTRQDNQARNGRCLRKCGGSRRKAWGGAWWNAGGNIIGAGINTFGNIWAADKLNDAYADARKYIVDAYGKMHGIDMSLLKRSDYAASHAMAALQAPIVYNGAQRAANERTLQRNLRRINRGTLSSAAAQNRSARAEVDYNDRLSQISDEENRTRQGIIQQNMQRITQVANENANRDAQANRDYAQAYLHLLEYNNDIDNEKIMGIADANSSYSLNRANTLANMGQAIASSWGNAITSTASGFANAYSNRRKEKHEENMTYMGMDSSSKYDALMSGAITDNPAGKARVLYDMYINEGDTDKAYNLLKTYGKKNGSTYTWD